MSGPVGPESWNSHAGKIAPISPGGLSGKPWGPHFWQKWQKCEKFCTRKKSKKSTFFTKILQKNSHTCFKHAGNRCFFWKFIFFIFFIFLHFSQICKTGQFSENFRRNFSPQNFPRQNFPHTTGEFCPGKPPKFPGGEKVHKNFFGNKKMRNFAFSKCAINYSSCFKYLRFLTKKWIIKNCTFLLPKKFLCTLFSGKFFRGKLPEKWPGCVAQILHFGHPGEVIGTAKWAKCIKIMEKIFIEKNRKFIKFAKNSKKSRNVVQQRAILSTFLKNIFSFFSFFCIFKIGGNPEIPEIFRGGPRGEKRVLHTGENLAPAGKKVAHDFFRSPFPFCKQWNFT